MLILLLLKTMKLWKIRNMNLRCSFLRGVR